LRPKTAQKLFSYLNKKEKIILRKFYIHIDIRCCIFINSEIKHRLMIKSHHYVRVILSDFDVILLYKQYNLLTVVFALFYIFLCINCPKLALWGKKFHILSLFISKQNAQNFKLTCYLSSPTLKSKKLGGRQNLF